MKITSTSKQQPAADDDAEIRRAIREGFESGETEGWIDAEEVMNQARAILEQHERKLKEDACDYRDAVSAKKKGGRTFSLAEMKRLHGLKR